MRLSSNLSSRLREPFAKSSFFQTMWNENLTAYKTSASFLAHMNE